MLCTYVIVEGSLEYTTSAAVAILFLSILNVLPQGRLRHNEVRDITANLLSVV